MSSQQEEKGIYIFGAFQTEEETPIGKIEIEGVERDIFVIKYKDAGIAACEAPMKIYHPNRKNLMMHQQAVSMIMEEKEAVIPISFGNVFHSKKDVQALMEKLYPQFEKLFPEIRGKVELGLKVIGKKEWLESIVKENTKISEISASVNGKSKAAGYYDRIKLGGAAQEVFSSLQQRMKEDLFLPLSEKADASKVNDPTGEKMLLNASFLVDKENEGKFDQLVNDLHEKWKGKLDFQYSGPWPAYNFVNIRLKVEEAG
ncbi:GvpL/GvpF family gas vesicle protein [Falsibacillus pallidus]|uniref:Gas vesicle protein GvpL/GvpF n=1 Tax=Falsibacillus pallidus TaxID=493781 RepID=A0A370GTV4_9BACI|nr:GvpL/GvpF family gas vesicle protein [Falsibacillus pallidus]RDI45974.1 gas vesicle protein GvpL/GvpF [Falsibacillus pallidus]